MSEEDDRGELVSHTLCNNIWDVIDHVNGFKSVNACKILDATARNTFIVSPAAASDAEGDVLHFGQPFCLRSHPALRVREGTNMYSSSLYLASNNTSSVAGSGAAGAQDVYMQNNQSIESSWRCVAADGNILASDGAPIPANEAVQIVHSKTNNALGASIAKPTGYALPFAPRCIPCLRRAAANEQQVRLWR